MKKVFSLIITVALGAMLMDAHPVTAQEKPTEKTKHIQTAKPQLTVRTKTRPEAARTLDAITIEGEIAVPQVLFITSRDYRRYRDGLRWKFRMNTVDVARSLDLPTRLRIVAKQKETQ